MRIFRKARWIVVAGVVAAVAAGVSYAAIPSSDGTISACLDAKGGLKVVDVEIPALNSGFCGGNAKLLTWNQKGPQGIQGPQGIPGVPGPSDAFVKSVGLGNAVSLPGNGLATAVTSLNLPAGKYLVSAKVDLFSFNSTNSGCKLSGSSTFDFQDAQTRPAAGIYDAGIPLTIAYESASAGQATLECWSDLGATARHAVVSAIKVGNLTSS